MCNTCQKEEEVKWVCEPKDSTYVLARCGMWEAKLATEVYAKGQIVVGPNDEHESDVPAFLGQPCKNIPEHDKLMKLIQEVCKRMVEKLPCCEMVYLASLNESSKGLHFWLIPRTKQHKEVLGIDGFVLMAELRNNWVRREIQDRWNMPPSPDKDGQKKLNNKWQEYANDYKKMFQDC